MWDSSTTLKQYDVPCYHIPKLSLHTIFHTPVALWGRARLKLQWFDSSFVMGVPCLSILSESHTNIYFIPLFVDRFVHFFNRRLVDMLSENEDVISFCPGNITNGQTVLGRIVVHDRIKVENEILPRYFNHSSFASLRRQLNYFSFTRIGKGRQKGATYCNEGVVVIEDILRLRRRSTTSSNSSAITYDYMPLSTKNHLHDQIEPLMTKSTSFSRSGIQEAAPRSRTKRALAVTSFRHSCIQGRQHMKKIRHGHCDHNKGNESTLHIVAPFAPPKLVSPVTSPLHSPSTPPSGTLKVTLDLTVPASKLPTRNMSATTNGSVSSVVSSSNGIHQAHRNNTHTTEDPDILAGCRALLCFSHGLHKLTAWSWRILMHSYYFNITFFQKILSYSCNQMVLHSEPT